MPLRMSSFLLLFHGTMWAASTTVWRKRGQPIFEKSSLCPLFFPAFGNVQRQVLNGGELSVVFLDFAGLG